MVSVKVRAHPIKHEVPVEAVEKCTSYGHKMAIEDSSTYCFEIY